MSLRRKVKRLSQTHQESLGQRIKENRKLRELARELRGLAEEGMEELNSEQKSKVWSLLFKEVFPDEEPEPGGGGQTQANSSMSYEDARSWGNTPMQFGKHRGTPVKEVPSDYLNWLDSQPDFRMELHRFLTSPYWRQQQHET